MFNSIISYAKKRVFEKSTWAGIGAAVISGLAIPAPWTLPVILIGVVGVLVPTSGGSGTDADKAE